MIGPDYLAASAASRELSAGAPDGFSLAWFSGKINVQISDIIIDKNLNIFYNILKVFIILNI
jgi:hypothetical protein